MKYMMMVKLDGKSEDGRKYEAGMPPDAKLGAAMGKLMAEMGKAGVLVDTGGLLPMSKGARIRAAGGKLTVTDGPFIESKEIIGGYAILRAKSKEEALKMGEDFMKLHVDVLGASYVGELEIRQMFDPADCGPEHAKC
ncbi:MAG: YciI family protein [Verrucomicrobiota bacterium]